MMYLNNRILWSATGRVRRNERQQFFLGEIKEGGFHPTVKALFASFESTILQYPL